jgi:LysM repeat protein
MNIGEGFKMPTHVVQAGETLWQIAQRYNTSVQEIIKTNNIQNPNSIDPGTILTIPNRNIAVTNYGSGAKTSTQLQLISKSWTY